MNQSIIVGDKVSAKYNGKRFEFLFASLESNAPHVFTIVQSVFRSYETTKLYRDMKLRGAIIKDNVDRDNFGSWRKFHFFAKKMQQMNLIMLL